MSAQDARQIVDYAKSLDCIHCGLCLTTCPTYRLTGNEGSSPRGRVHLMRAVAEERLEADEDFAAEMDFCLLCRHCESVCPAGVQFGSMMELTRGALAATQARPLPARLARWIGFRVLLRHRAALRAFAWVGRLGQTLRLDRLAAPVLRRFGIDVADLPAIPPARHRARLPRRTPAEGASRGPVAMLEGCVMPELFGDVNRATVESLAALGHDVEVPSDQVCCGSLHAHNGELETARELAQRNIEAFEASAGPLVVNSAGCGSHMREVHHLFDADDPWRERAERFAERVRDYSEVVTEALDGRSLELPPGALEGPVAWDDPCHLCHGQQIRDEPRAILDAIGGLERREMPGAESCCGSAGIYSILRPDDSRAILEPKLEELERSGARTLVTGNPGCHMQWESGLRRRGAVPRVMHLAQVVAAALRGR